MLSKGRIQAVVGGETAPSDRHSLPGLPPAALKTVCENVALAMQVIERKPRHTIGPPRPRRLDLVGCRAGIASPRTNSPAVRNSAWPSPAIGERPRAAARGRAATSTPRHRWAIMRLLDRINRTGTTVVWRPDATIVNQMRKRVIELRRPATLSATRTAASTGPGGKESEASFYFSGSARACRVTAR